MPIYEYECCKCGDVFEVFQKHTDPAPEGHDCGSKQVKRLISRTSFVLKGTGWYVTDYARKGKKDGSKDGSSEGSSEGSGGESKSKPKSSASSEQAA